jgi:nucleoside-diphosphate-sugar epimerase
MVDTDVAAQSGDTPSGAPRRPLVVVTGGSGLLGSRLVDRLHTDHDVVVLDLQGDPRSPADVDFICTDLTSDESVDRALQRILEQHGDRIASVVHLAAYYDFAGGDSALYQEITVDGTRRLLEGLGRFDVEQFVFSSTMLVHEPTEPGEEIDERDPVSESWPYPTSKVETEAVIDRHRDVSRSQVIVRIAGAYDEDGHSPPITNQIKRIDGKWPTSHFYPADPQRGQAFVHVDDAVDALVRIVERRRELPEHYPVLIGEPDTVGYGELQDIIGCALHGSEWRTFRVPPTLARVGAWVREKNPFGEYPFIRSWMIDRASDHYDLDISSAREHLDWEPEHHVAEVVPVMVERLRDDRDGWYRRNDLHPPRRILP